MSYVEDGGYACPEMCCVVGHDWDYRQPSPFDDPDSQYARPMYQVLYSDPYASFQDHQGKIGTNVYIEYGEIVEDWDFERPDSA